MAERNPRAAQRLLESIFAALERVCIFPEAAPLVLSADEPDNTSGVRKLIETKYRYVIYYRVMDGGLLVLRIFHPSQKR